MTSCTSSRNKIRFSINAFVAAEYVHHGTFLEEKKTIRLSDLEEWNILKTKRNLKNAQHVLVVDAGTHFEGEKCTTKWGVVSNFRVKKILDYGKHVVIPWQKSHWMPESHYSVVLSPILSGSFDLCVMYD